MRMTFAFSLALSLVNSSPASAQDCTAMPTGMTPLPDLVNGTYKNFTGGLYDGTNSIPGDHFLDGLDEASSVKPLDEEGNVDFVDGRVAVVSLGMSLTRQTFGPWQEQYSDQDPNRAPGVLLIDGTVAGQTSAEWSNGISGGGVQIWESVQNRVAAAGVTANQVQVAFIYMVAEYTDAFPNNARKLQSDLETIVQRTRTEFPNCRLAYLASPHYLGYSTADPMEAPGRHEPYAYEDGFGVKWLIEKQINGDADLAFNPPTGDPKAPWLAWAPYLWADGTTVPGEFWECEDFVSDGVHLSFQGQDKLAIVLDSFFTTAQTTTPWYLASPASSSSPVSLAFRYGAACTGTGGKSPRIFTDAGPTITNALPYSGNSDFQLRVSGAPPDKMAVLGLAYDPDPNDALMHSQAVSSCGVFIHDPTTTYTGTTNMNGAASVPFGIPSSPALIGFEFYMQWFIDDMNGELTMGSGAHFSASRGMKFRIGLK